jgi:hypothetical protein
MTRIRLCLLARERIEAIFPQVLWRHLLQRAALHPFESFSFWPSSARRKDEL